MKISKPVKRLSSRARAIAAGAGRTFIGRNFKTLIVAILTEVDTLTIRAVMGWSSIVFALLLFASQQPFTKDAYGIMEALGPQWMWAMVFVSYGGPTVFLVYCKKHRPQWNLAFNIYGFLLWGFCLISMIVALGYISPIMAPYLIVLPLMGWSIVRTSSTRRIR